MSEMTRKQKTAWTMEVFSEHGFLDLHGYKPIDADASPTGEMMFCVELPKGMLGNAGQYVRCTSFKKHKTHWHTLVAKQSETEYGEVWSIEYLDTELIPDNVPDIPWPAPASGGDTVPMTAPTTYNAVASESSVEQLTERLNKAAGVIKEVRRDNEDLKARVKRLEDAMAGKSFDDAKVPAEADDLPY